MTFVKGKSGNPKGRPKEGESWAKMLSNICEEELTHDGKTLSKKEAICRRLVSEAAKGEQWAINALMDRIDGRPKTVSEIDHTSGGKEITGIVREIVRPE